VERDGRIYGLGAHDMKGGAACALAAIEAIFESGAELGGDLIVSGTSDEEYWSRGVHELIEAGMLEDCRYCMVPEPAPHATILIGQRGRHQPHSRPRRGAHNNNGAVRRKHMRSKRVRGAVVSPHHRPRLRSVSHGSDW